MCGWLIHPLSYESKGAKSRYHAEQQVEKGGYTQIGDVLSNKQGMQPANSNQVKSRIQLLMVKLHYQVLTHANPITRYVNTYKVGLG